MRLRIHDILARKVPESTLFLIYAAVIGVGGGYGAVGFRAMIELVTRLAYNVSQQGLSSYHGWRVFVAPALGGLLVGLIVFFFAREARGHGVPEVMFAITEGKGIIRPRIVVFKALASAICIGSGGSVGREGPIVQIGSAWGSTFGRLFGVQEKSLKTLIACGAAAGIAATFNSPIGGVLFACEVILGSFAISNLGYIVVASVLSAAIGRIYFGNFASFPVPPYAVGGVAVLGAFVLLGLAGGLYGVLYTRVLYGVEDLWERLRRVPPWAKPALGGLLVGAAGYFFPQVLSVGYPTVEQALRGNLDLQLLVALLFLKLLVTSLTIASGGSGGVFAPGLYMGSLLGGAFGVVAKAIVPGLSVTDGAFAMVGMATVFAGSARAPITAIVMLFEMTGNYELILPLMLSTVIATSVASVIEPESIYTLKLRRRGVDIVRKRQSDRLAAIIVAEAMYPLSAVLDDTMTLDAALDLLERLDAPFGKLRTRRGAIRGVVSREDLLKTVRRRGGAIRLSNVRPTKTGGVLESAPLSVATRIMSDLGVGFLLVLDEGGAPTGVIDTQAIIRSYGEP